VVLSQERKRRHYQNRVCRLRNAQAVFEAENNPQPPDLSDFTSLRDQPIPRQEISDQALYDHLLRIEHEPNRATRKKLATKAFFALISKLDKENDQFYQSMLSDDTPCEGVDINNKPYSF
jgi:hypothetical protein